MEGLILAQYHEGASSVCEIDIGNGGLVRYRRLPLGFRPAESTEQNSNKVYGESLSTSSHFTVAKVVGIHLQKPAVKCRPGSGSG